MQIAAPPVGASTVNTRQTLSWTQSATGILIVEMAVFTMKGHPDERQVIPASVLLLTVAGNQTRSHYTENEYLNIR